MSENKSNKSKKTKIDKTEKIGEYSSGETGGVYGLAVTIAVINLALVGLVALINLVLLSSGVLLFFLLGFYAVFLALKDALTEKNKKGGLLGLAGLAINVVALVIYLMIMKSRFVG